VDLRRFYSSSRPEPGILSQIDVTPTTVKDVE
jgi:hypothetical protein